MTIGCQYGEQDIINKFFGDKIYAGYIVDIGAADGIDNSNSYELIKDHGWHGLLIEPNLSYFYLLQEQYKNLHNRIKLCPFAASDQTGLRNFTINGQCSSLVYHLVDKLMTRVMCLNTTHLLDLYNVPQDFDFLSIDCEGEDLNILKSLDYNKYKPALICVEHSMSFDVLNQLMFSRGYQFLDKTLGNSFFQRKLL